MTDAADEQHAEAVHELRLALELGEPGILSTVFHPRVELIVDDGGRAEADAVRGSAGVAERLCELLGTGGITVTEQSVNGRPGLVFRRRGSSREIVDDAEAVGDANDAEIVGIITVDVDNRFVTDVWVVLNPAKLKHWNADRVTE